MHLASAAEIKEQSCLPFQRGTRFHPASLNSWWMNGWMDGLIPTVDQPFRNFSGVVLSGLLQDQNYPLWTWRWEWKVCRKLHSFTQSGRHLCHYQHGIQPPPNVAPDQDHKDGIINNVLKQS